MKAIVCGAGIAGLSTTWFLARDGWEVLLLEKAPALRDDGYMIDFFSSGYDAAERMGLLPRLAQAAYDVDSVDWVDAGGKVKARLLYDRFRKMQKGRVFSFMRGDLERALYEALPENVETRFSSSVAEIHTLEGGIDATLTDGARKEADLLVGAGGVHSTVRTQIFGPEKNFLRPLGFHVAAYIFRNAAIEAALGKRFQMLSVPGRVVGLYAIRGGRIASFFVHESRDLEHPSDPLAALKRVYGDLPWLVPETLKGGSHAENIYYDIVAQVEMENWRRGRVVLIGDAAYAVSLLAGQGASLAMGGAYVLAEELRVGSVDEGLARYETRLAPQLLKKQAAGRNAAKWIVPPDEMHIFMRNWSLRLANLPGLNFLLAPVLTAGSESVLA